MPYQNIGSCPDTDVGIWKFQQTFCPDISQPGSGRFGQKVQNLSGLGPNLGRHYQRSCLISNMRFLQITFFKNEGGFCSETGFLIRIIPIWGHEILSGFQVDPLRSGELQERPCLLAYCPFFGVDQWYPRVFRYQWAVCLLICFLIPCFEWTSSQARKSMSFICWYFVSNFLKIEINVIAKVLIHKH